VASVQQPGSDVPIRYIDVSRTGLQDRFFHNFEFDTADELLAALAGMEIDLATMARSHDLRREAYSGWVYWLLYLKGYIQYTESGKVGSGNVYFDFLTKFYCELGHDHGLWQELGEPGKVAERVVRRFPDIDLDGVQQRRTGGSMPSRCAQGRECARHESLREVITRCQDP
jgi:hypothetical protein